MQRQVVVPPTGLLPHRPYSPAILSGHMLFVSGHTGSDPVTRAFEPDIRAQTRQALCNIRDILVAADGGLADIVKVGIFMTDMAADFSGMNEVFREFFPTEPPARTTVGVAHLARPGLLIEIEAIAVLAKR